MNTEPIKTTPISEVGEFGLIKAIADSFSINNKETIKGIGDDAAVLNHSGKQTVVTTDILVEGVHFDLSYCPLKHLGYKSVVVNLSDVYAMNATPKQILISLALSSRYTLEAVEELMLGVKLACENYSVDLVGGDTTSSQLGLILNVTAIGVCDKEKVVFRSGAKEHDLLCVSGDLGAAYIGLQVLEREKTIFKGNSSIQPDLTGFDYVLERQLKPEARKDVVELFNELGILPTSMIDISDGLASEILHLCHGSGVGCRIYEEKIPIDHLTNDAAEQFNLSPVTCALNGGEDYELLFTIKQSDYDKIKHVGKIHTIGHITEKSTGSHLVTKTNELIELKAQGWDGLKK
ncbi:MAG: thiamine-phosphate kinase [Flavobacteriales bacterium]